MGNQPHTPKRIHYMKTYKSTNVSPSRSISPSPTVPSKEKLEIKDTIIYDYEINKTINFANQFLTIKDLNNKNIHLTKDSSSFINLKILNDLGNNSNPSIEKIKLLKFYENIKNNENTIIEKNNEKKSSNFYEYIDSPTGPNVRSSLKSNK